MTPKYTAAHIYVAIAVGAMFGAWIEREPREPSRVADLNATCVHYSRGYNIGKEDGFAQGVQSARHDLSMVNPNEPIGCALDALEIEQNEEFSR